MLLSLHLIVQLGVSPLGQVVGSANKSSRVIGRTSNTVRAKGERVCSLTKERYKYNMYLSQGMSFFIFNTSLHWAEKKRTATKTLYAIEDWSYFGYLLIQVKH